MSTVRVPVEVPEAPYDITIGHRVLGELPALLDATCPAARYAVITDSTVADLYGRKVAHALGADVFVFPAGEWNKTREQWSALADQLLAAGIGRDAAIIAVGGGVTGDLAGFVAATYFRGIPYVQVPTTLLAMIDSSIGGKTGVDTPHGKNLIGAFHQPRAVLADVAVLDTLPPPQLAAGMAEVVKHGLLADGVYLERVIAARELLHAHDPATLLDVVRRGVEIKAEVVAGDVRESGRRAILNLGHTVAHAVERVSGYEILHGEAVAIGLVVESQIGHALGITSDAARDRTRSAIEAFGLPTEIPRGPAHTLLEAMRADKKNRRGTVRFAFLKEVGIPARSEAGEWTVEAPDGLIIEVVARNI